VNFELTDNQAEKMAEKIVGNNFFMAGIGHFDLNFEEIKTVLKLAFGHDADRKLSKYYKKLKSRMD